jgi:hypothetical protein
MQTIVMTSDISSHLLGGFRHQWRKYTQDRLDFVVCGYEYPYSLEKTGVRFYPISDDFEKYPPNKWSDSLILVLEEVADEVFVLMLDDYWIVRQIDLKGVAIAYDYMQQFRNVVKFDLTTDRLYADPGKYVYGYNTYNTAGHLDLIKSDYHSPYHMSLWGGMWRRDLLRDMLVPGETAQQIELNGTARLAQYGDDLLVLGTRQSPVRHANVVQGGQWNQDLNVGLPALSQADLSELRNLGYI